VGEDGRPAADRRRASADVALPYFAPFAGAVPADGTPLVGDVRLPPGSRCKQYWASDGPVPDAHELAHRLAGQFTHTGLWPVLWNAEFDVDQHANGMSGYAPPERRRGDAKRVFRRGWEQTTLDGPFPGLADGTRAIRPFAFGAAYEHRRTAGYSGAPALLLVPANRPSDVIARLRAINTGWVSDADIGTVARSWEERFGAVPTLLGPGWLVVSVGAPPTTFAQARRVADEHVALSPDTGSELDEYARTLMPARPATGLSLQTWELGWAD
jgi:hypothetical protein